jgi:hypothetical protein
LSFGGLGAQKAIQKIEQRLGRLVVWRPQIVIERRVVLASAA